MSSESVLKKGEIVTLLTSYCDDDSADCTDQYPCKECIAMCNTYELTEKVIATYKGQVGKDINTINIRGLL